MELTGRQIIFYCTFICMMFFPFVLILISPQNQIVLRLTGFPGWHIYVIVLVIIAGIIRSILLRYKLIEK